MPKNTYFIKENYKKVEEVREIKSEIPTYEEFLKNYNQEQVNYNDLTHADIGSGKSYGPMWGNSQYGERWISLRMPCPVSSCSNRNNGNVINQTHTCGGQAEISNQARVRCQRCGAVSRIESWNFSCSSHSGGYADINSFTNALMIDLNNGSMDSGIVMELLQYLRKNNW
jgi:hypothetical protein